MHTNSAYFELLKEDAAMTRVIFTRNKWQCTLGCVYIGAILLAASFIASIAAASQHTMNNSPHTVVRPVPTVPSVAPRAIQPVIQPTHPPSKVPSKHELYLQARSSSALAHSEGLSSNTLTRLEAPHTTDLTKKQATRLPSDARISFEFQKAALADVLEAFSTFTGANLIISDQVHGNVSLRLKNVPWQEAFDTLLTTQGLAMQRRGDILWIAPAADIARQEKQHAEAQIRATDRAPLSTSIFEMRYQRAEEVRTLLNGMAEGSGKPGNSTASERFLSKRGVAMVDSRTNQLFVIDVPERIEHIKHLLLAIDRPVPQVSIEAQIVEAEEGFSRSLGARLSILGSTDGSPSAPGRESDKEPKESDPTSLAASRFLAREKKALYDLPASGVSGFNPASIGFTLFGVGASRIIALELSMLEAKGQGKILSSPRVVTADRVKAQIEQGTELPYQAKVGHGVSGVQFRRAGLRLEVTPHIMPNGYVTLDLDVSKDSVGTETISGPAIHTKHVQTQVHVQNAGTVAIGGIFTQDQRSDIVRLPWLGELPVIGALFRKSIKNQRKNELLIFITPHIITESHKPPPALFSTPMQSFE